MKRHVLDPQHFGPKFALEVYVSVASFLYRFRCHQPAKISLWAKVTRKAGPDDRYANVGVTRSMQVPHSRRLTWLNPPCFSIHWVTDYPIYCHKKGIAIHTERRRPSSYQIDVVMSDTNLHLG